MCRIEDEQLETQGREICEEHDSGRKKMKKPQVPRPGRPLGSKNKPRNAVVNYQKAMKTITLEVAAGYELVRCLTQYCKVHAVDVGIFAAVGRLANVSIYQPGRQQIQSLSGPFEIVSLSGYCSATCCSLTVVLGNNQFRAEQGFVGSKLSGSCLIAGAAVYITTSPFVNPAHHKMNSNGEDESGNSIVYASPRPFLPPPAGAMVNSSSSASFLPS